jgi:hypothetical protein
MNVQKCVCCDGYGRRPAPPWATAKDPVACVSCAGTGLLREPAPLYPLGWPYAWWDLSPPLTTTDRVLVGTDQTPDRVGLDGVTTSVVTAYPPGTSVSLTSAAGGVQ